ncbi:MAG TPA: ATP-binding protein [Burkholderiales bacterium]|nr:ATP-binding protein [Burkholderiales bacterium]
MKRLDRVFAARLAAFEQVKALIEEFSAAARLGSEDRHKLTLIVEELFTNTINHGFHGDTDSPVDLTLEQTGEGVRVRYKDSAPQHNPISSGQQTDIDAAVRLRRVGGIGMAITLGLTRDATYDYVDGRNCVTLTYLAKPLA